MASSGRPDIGISAIPYAPIRQIRQNSPLPGLFPKSPSTVPFLSNFSSKILASPPLIIRKSEQKRYTPAALFSKKLPLSTTDYRKNTPKRSHSFRTFFQKTFIFYRGYFQNDTPLCCRFQKKIRKNLHLTTDYQDCRPILLHPFSTFLKKKHSSSIGVMSKTNPSCVATFRKKSEKTSSHH